MEGYLAFSVGKLQFLDSMQFTLKGLDKLVETLHVEDFIRTKHRFQNHTEFYLMKQKGIFPYDMITDLSVIFPERPCTFPLQEHFKNKLKDEECSMDDYLHAQCVWETFGCKSMKAYHDLYLESDVLLLADFFEKFRDMCLDSYGLDAAHYFTAPGMAWDAALKMTKVNLELLTDADMYTFFERSIRGGISQISKRYAKANNPNCDTYDPLKPITHLIYLDANNLYGWAMSQMLPTGSFKWVRVCLDDICDTADDADFGYILEVDMEYPDAIHGRHSDYPLAPEKLSIHEEMLSPFQKLHFPKGRKKTTEKLTPHLQSKTNYVVHYRNLKFYLEQGMVVTCVHRVLKFKQEAWLKPYIDSNTASRARSNTEFAKDFFKLMNNSVFGKTQENLRNRISVELIANREVALKRVAKPNFKRSVQLHEDLVIMETAVTNLILNKPVYVGFSVLDLSKLLMYQYHYNKMLPAYPNKINLCFTDTDSLLYEVETPDIYADMLENRDEYDFSGYPFNHPCYSDVNKKVIGKFKDELNSLTLNEFIGLGPKCYSLQFLGEVKKNVVTKTSQQEKQIAKAVKESVKNAHLRHHHYQKVRAELATISVKQNQIKSVNHKIGTIHQTKVALTAFDTKRWICDDNIHTLAHGHYATSLVEDISLDL